MGHIRRLPGSAFLISVCPLLMIDAGSFPRGVQHRPEHQYSFNSTAPTIWGPGCSLLGPGACFCPFAIAPHIPNGLLPLVFILRAEKINAALRIHINHLRGGVCWLRIWDDICSSGEFIFSLSTPPPISSCRPYPRHPSYVIHCRFRFRRPHSATEIRDCCSFMGFSLLC